MQLAQFASANFIPEPAPSGIQITSAGAVEGTNMIQRSDNTYTLVGDIQETIVVLRDNIVLDGAGYALQGNGSGSGVFLQERSSVTIKNLQISGFEYGLKFTWGTYGYGSSASEGNTISDNTITNNRYGIYISDFSQGNIITGNHVTNNTNGIYLGSCHNNKLRNNRIDNNAYNFFVGAGSPLNGINDIDTSNTINNAPIIYWLNQKGKTVPANAGYIALINCTEMTIQGFTLAHNGQAVLLVALTNSTITHNTLSENGNGIWLIQSLNNKISENTITNSTCDAFYIVSSNQTEMSYNKFTGNGLNGTPIAEVLGSYGRGALRLTQCSGNTIFDNEITENGEGINLQASRDNTISANLLADNDGSAVHLFDSTSNTITTNTIVRNNGSGVRLWMSNKNAVYSNQVLNNNLGIHLDKAAENSIIKNMIVNNTGFGMKLESASNNFLSSANNTIVHNNFINNQLGEGLDVSIPALWVHPEGSVPGVGNAWDNGNEGNYWSDYSTRYPNASEVDNTGVGNTPYFINENNIDHYPFLVPLDTSAIPYPAPLLLSMPEEHLIYTITPANGEFLARIDGTYPTQILRNTLPQLPESLPLLYPVPPGTTNIHIELDGAELEWNNYTQSYPSALHHTAIGDWQMINCTISPVPESFVLKIHYEHPIPKVNGSYLFLYDLNISPYLSFQSPTSIAYFQIRTDSKISNLKAYTTQTDSVWNPINSTLSNEGTTQLFAIQIYSEYSKPLPGDLVVTFNVDVDGTPQSSSPTVLALLTLTITAAVASLIFLYRKKRAKGAKAT
jgi:parallel beta-helix repeat protein